MKQFFYKKYFFAALFLIFILGFSVVNVIYCAEEWGELGQELQEVKDVETLKVWMHEAERKSAEEIIGRMEFVEGYGWLQNVLGKREFNHFSFIRDDDGMMYYGSLAEGTNDDLEQYAGNVRRLKEAVEANGAKLIVVVPPSKLLYGISEVDPDWPINNPNARMDKFFNLMMKNDVFAIDMRVPMQKSGEELEDLFFKTDHHWTPLAAFYAVKEMVEQVEIQYGDEWDPTNYYTNLENYNKKLYEQAMLGSHGRNTGITYSGLDDYLLLWPECDMEFTWKNYEKDTEQHGDFREAFFDKSVFEIADLYKSSLNMVYLREVVTHDKIENRDNEDGPKLAVLRDSYFSPMACFLAPMCSEIEMIWNKRSYNEADFEAFVTESDADYIVLEIYPYNLDAESFDFFKETEEKEGVPQ